MASGAPRVRPVRDRDGSIILPGDTADSLAELASGGQTPDEPDTDFGNEDYGEQDYGEQEEYAAADDFEPDYEAAPDDEPYTEEPAYQEPASKRPRRAAPARQVRETPIATSSGVAAFVVGMLLATAGVVMMFAWSGWEGLQTTMQDLGLAPVHIVTVGLVIAGVAGLRRLMCEHANALAAAAPARRTAHRIGRGHVAADLPGRRRSRPRRARRRRQPQRPGLHGRGCEQGGAPPRTPRREGQQPLEGDEDVRQAAARDHQQDLRVRRRRWAR